MDGNRSITASSIIIPSSVVRNGIRVFDFPKLDIHEFLSAAYKELEVQYPKFHKMDNLSKLGWLAVEILLSGEIDKERYSPEDIGIVLSNSNASLDADIRYQRSVSDIPSPAMFVYTLPNIVIGEICIRNGFKGEGVFFITEHFDAELIYQQASAAMDNGSKACICGWVDVLGEEYTAALFLVEEIISPDAMLFTTNNMNNLFEYK